MNKKHTYAICAYKESPFLEDCILSLRRQTYKSNIIMVTSTANDYIRDLADKYDIRLYVNRGEGGIVQDWNFAYTHAESEYVTITHQDDVYFPTYTECMLKKMNQAERPLIYFTDYAEVRKGSIVKKNKLLKVKRILLSPLKIKRWQNSIFIRRRILSLGSPICCPSVTFCKQNLPETVFKVGFRSDEDWEAWEMISKLNGAFVYDHEILMGHRIHEESETSIILGDGARQREDYMMFCKFWPKWIAKILTKAYSTSEKSNGL